MVVPSNDFFIGNDSPTAYRLFDAAGNLRSASITIKASEIWDAGSEVFDPDAAAFVGNNDLRTPRTRWSPSTSPSSRPSTGCTTGPATPSTAA
jgi:hypothetical protein